MSERNDEYFKQFIGKKSGPEKYRVKGKGLSKYAEAIGDKNPKYYREEIEGGAGADYSTVNAHPAYAATYTIPGLLMALPEIVDSNGEKLVKNIGKLLHTGQEYDFEGCVPLTEQDKKVYTTSEITKLFLKGGKLWVEIKFTSTNQEGTKTFCKTTLSGLLREGGF